ADGKAEFYSGNYSFYALEKERRYQERLKQYQKEQAKIDQLTEAADRLRLWAFMGNDATFKRAASMEKRIERMRTTAKPSKSRKMDARFASTEFHGDEVLALRNVAKGFGDKLLFEGINLKVEGGERIALIGDNGTGKSTLVSMITEETYPDDGRIKLGPAVKYACLPQIIHFDHPDWNLVENMMAARRDLSAQSARNRLAAYEFRGEDVFKPVSVLSGGEQSRLRLCMLMDDEINFLILDEPTNHLDIDSREWMEDAVEAYDGTLLFVSHDRYFINRFATRIWELADGTITDYPMGFTQYRQMKAQEELQKYDAPKPVKEKTITERSRSNRGQQAARRQLTIVERDVAKTEERLSALDGAMEAAACDYEKLGELLQEKELVQAELEALYEKWEALSEEGE
ncbi:MAG: ATP-binding cassette domain-containing protein, partial [Oscillibacter sp.]